MYYHEHMTLLAILGLFTLAALSVFQLLLALGRPLGDFAWGGKYQILPTNLRIASVISIILYIVFGLFLASKANIVTIIPDSQTLDVGIWVLAVYFVIGVVMNIFSRSMKERIVMAPVALLLATIFLATAII